MDEEKKVSIVVPVYNVEKYIRECIDSIIEQTYQNIEIILVDDGSTDTSGTICDEYAASDNRIKVIHKKNGGLSDARNTGIENVTGKYILFCDSDDYLDYSAVSILTEVIKNSNLDFVFFNATVFSDEGLQFKENGYIRIKSYTGNNPTQLLFQQLIFDEYKPSVCLFFFKTDFILKNQLRFKKGIISEDELFSFYAYKSAKKVKYLKDTLYYRRVRIGSIMTNQGNTREKFESLYSIFCDLTKEALNIQFDFEKAYMEYMSRISKSLLLSYRNLKEDDKDTFQEEYEHIKQELKNQRYFRDVSICLRLHLWKLGVLCSGIRKYMRGFYYEKINHFGDI